MIPIFTSVALMDPAATTGFEPPVRRQTRSVRPEVLLELLNK